MNMGNRKDSENLNERPFYLDRFEVKNNIDGRSGREKASGKAQNTSEAASQKASKAKIKPALRRNDPNRFFNFSMPDVTFLFLVLVLLIIGLVMMFSASYTYAYYDYKTGHDALYYIKKQLKYALGGLVVMLAVSFINYRKYNGILSILAYVGTGGLLLVTLFVNIGKDSDFKRWLSIGSVRFQPSELAKFGLILMLAYVTARQYGVIYSKKPMRDGFFSDIDNRYMSKVRGSFYKNASTRSLALTMLYTMLVSVFCVLVLLENHISGTILFFLIGVSMMWLAGVKKGYFVLLAVIVGIAVAVVIIHPEILPGYAGERIIAWKDKSYQPLGARWQTNQSLRAIASGGPFGLGLGNSRQKHMYVSEPQNDFIFAIVCEELGYVGAGVIIVLFGALVWRAFKIAEKSGDVFGSMLAMGIALQVGLQVFLNIAVVTDIFPNTGISLPFFSYGGTSLVMLLAEMGVILSVSKQYS